jgi:hypothetical protein
VLVDDADRARGDCEGEAVLEEVAPQVAHR